jgi:glutamate racemase
MNKKIGIFDSGFGGLIILSGVKKELPQYSYVYFGDNLRIPYGNLSQEQIYKNTYQAVDLLFKKQCSIVVVACNTVSVKALRRLQQEMMLKENKRRVLGVAVPIMEEVVKEALKNNNTSIAILGTKITIESQVYQREFRKKVKTAKIYSRACPLLIPLIESGKLKSKELDQVLKKYVKTIVKKKINLLVLACTHFHYLDLKINKLFSGKLKIIKTPEVVASKLKKYLNKHKDLEKNIARKKDIVFYTTGDTKQFEEFYKNNFNKRIAVKKVKIF